MIKVRSAIGWVPQSRQFRGMCLSLAAAGGAFLLWWFTKRWVPISPLMWSFIFGIVWGNVFAIPQSYGPGIDFAASRLLKGAVALLGILVSAMAWTRLGGIGLACVLANLFLTFVLGLVLCRYVFRLERRMGLLVAIGTAICGASAIAVTAPAIEAKSEEVGVSLAVVTLFGLAAMFSYPWLFQATALGPFLNHSVGAFGMWTGMGIHETAQVVAGAEQVNGALDMAMLAKSIRIFMIGPMVLLVSFLFRRADPSAGIRSRSLVIPWFAVVFIVLSLVNMGLELVFRDVWTSFAQSFLSPPIKFLLAWAFAAVGLKVRFREIAKLGLRTFAFGLTTAVLSSAMALMLVRFAWLSG